MAGRRDLSFLTRRPFAHRGLHDAAAGVMENTLPAFAAAIAGNYGIELDIQASADGVPVVFHDDTLDRLTLARGPVRIRTASALAAIAFKAGTGRILPLAAVLEAVAGQVPLLIEIKSHFDGDTRLALRAAEVLAGYAGPFALMSFDPAMIAEARRAAPGIIRGIVAEYPYLHPEWAALGLKRAQKRSLRNLTHWPQSRFDFVAYRVADLDRAPPRLARRLGFPLLTWTVRSPEDRERAASRADQIIFEGFRP